VGTRREARKRRLPTLVVVAPTECDAIVKRLQLEVCAAAASMTTADSSCKPLNCGWVVFPGDNRSMLFVVWGTRDVRQVWRVSTNDDLEEVGLNCEVVVVEEDSTSLEQQSFMPLGCSTACVPGALLSKITPF
jgi:hypothetical protein